MSAAEYPYEKAIKLWAEGAPGDGTRGCPDPGGRAHWLDFVIAAAIPSRHSGSVRSFWNRKMPKIKAVVAMKQRLQEALGQLGEQEEVLELVRRAVAQYELKPTDVFSIASLEAAVLKSIVADSIPYCDRNGNTWSGVGRRPAWLSEALQAGAALEDFRNPNFRRESQQVEPFCDGDGNTWSGRGRRPTWLTEAINGGADLEDFRNPAHAGS